ncbi:MAG: tyrosine-type recombinase/integrase [Clostridia bacterium]
MANKLLSTMQSDFEINPEAFRIEKYTQQRSDVIPYLREWIKTQKDSLSPATYHDYLNSIENHLVPWFKTKDIQLHELRYDDLCKLLSEIKREGKGKQNTMFCLHACLKYAWKSGRIVAMPPFPERRRYGIVDKKIVSIPEARQIAVINAIPAEHQPIFWWLKYHYRRPSEAIVLRKEDYDKERDCFIIRRGLSRKVETDRTKTGAIHDVPCAEEFRPYLQYCLNQFSSYMFSHSSSRLNGKRYQSDFLNDLWNKACKECGESIRMYAGLKHSSCNAFVNEQGHSIDELQMLTDHKRRDSVLKYTDVKLEAKRRLMGKVIKLDKVGEK